MSETVTIPSAGPGSEILPPNVEQLLPHHDVLDSDRFLRSRFMVPASATTPAFEVQFRGKEELPIAEGDSSLTNVILSSDIVPVRTSSEKFSDWKSSLTGSNESMVLGRPGSSDSRGALLSGADKPVLVHAPATMEGLVDVALLLASDRPEDSASLLSMREELATRKYSKRTLDLMKQTFNVSSSLEVDGNREQGLMLMALSLSGDEGAKQAVDRLSEEFDEKYVASRVGALSVNGEVEPKAKFTEAGDAVDKNVIEKVKEAGLVAVHTSRSVPVDGKILSTAEYNVNTADQFPRDSIHLALNHTVTSHMWGDFSSQKATVIAPMAGMLELNGAPAAMADVDTYWMATAGSAIELPKETIIVELVDEPLPDGDLVDSQKGSYKISVADLRESGKVLGLADQIKRLRGDNNNLSSSSYYSDSAYLSSTLTGYGSLDIDQAYNRSKQKADDTSVFWAGRTEEDKSQVKKEAADLEALIIKYPIDEKGLFPLAKLLEDEEMLKTNDTLNGLLVESMRRVMVDTAIRSLGGKVVKGGAHYTFDEAFQDKTSKLAAEVGVTTLLHAHSNESRFEHAHHEALVDSSRETGYFDATSRDTSGAWYWASESPGQVRIRAIETGALSFAKKQPEPKPARYDNMKF